MKKYTVGLDYGTLSVRAVIVDTENGQVEASASYEYPHGVMSDTVGEVPLRPDSALQHPKDYIDGLSIVIREAMRKGGIHPEQIVGVGIDFTSSTVMAVDECGTPLCMKEEFASSPDAYVKLWKHHGAIEECDRLNEIAKARGESWLRRYGGKINCEFMIPKIYETMTHAPEVYDATYRFIEAGDWIVWQLTGVEAHSVCTTGFKAAWSASDGYPTDDFFLECNEKLAQTIKAKLPKNIITMDKAAGYITDSAARLTGLMPGTAVAPALIDAHSALPASGICKDGSMLMIIGTSSCHILVSDKESPVQGISGYVKDAIYVGKYVYEAGQSAVGDAFSWFIDNCVPSSYFSAAKEMGIGIHEYLSLLAGRIEPTPDSPIAIDWWNGCRAPYSDAGLKGCIIGLDITTPPEAIWRAILESTAYGTRRIIELYRDAGIEINDLVAAGGIPKKNPLLTSIYADVLGMDVFLSEASESSALGAAFAAMAVTGMGSLEEISERLGKRSQKPFTPDPCRKNVYNKLYEKYKKLSDFLALEL